MDKAVIYARYSSDNQRDASIDQQVTECRKYADLMGYEVIRIYADRALTGKTDKRPDFLKMIKDSAKQEFSYVIVYALDRFSRNKYDSAIYKQRLKENGVRVLSSVEHITDDPTGALMESILEGFAQYYSDELSQKIHRGLNDNAEKAIVNGSVPLGFRRGKDGHAEIVPEEAEIVREIFRRVNNDEQLIRIVEDFNRRGLRTKKGALWNKSSFNKILSNERYIGVYLYKEHRIPGGFPSIIEKELFDQVQEKIGSKPRARGDINRRRTDSGAYLLTGKLYCGMCEHPMVGISGKGRSGTLCFYYSCNGKRIDHVCDKKNIRRDPIELSVTQAVHDMLMDDDLLDWMADRAVAYQESPEERQEAEGIEKALEDVRKRKSNLLTAMEVHGIFTDTTRDRMIELEKEEKALARQMSAIEHRRKTYGTKDDFLSYLEMLRDCDVHDKHFQELLIDSFVGRVYAFEDHFRIYFNFLKEGERRGVDIPFETEGKGGNETEPSDGLYKLFTAPHHGAIQTPVTVRFVKGWFVADFPFAG